MRRRDYLEAWVIGGERERERQGIRERVGNFQKFQSGEEQERRSLSAFRLHAGV